MTFNGQTSVMHKPCPEAEARVCPLLKTVPESISAHSSEAVKHLPALPKQLVAGSTLASGIAWPLCVFTGGLLFVVMLDNLAMEDHTCALDVMLEASGE